MSNQKCYRQGEILFIKVNVAKEHEGLIKKNCSVKHDNVIREGEVTGHMHRASSNAKLFEFNRPNSNNNDITFWDAGQQVRLPAGQMFLTADDKIVITHDEHKPLTLDKGDYVIRIQREYDEEKDRLIAD